MKMLPNLRAEELDLNNNYVCVIEILYLQITSHVLPCPPTQVWAITALLDSCGHLSTGLSASTWSPLESASHVASRPERAAQSSPAPSHSMLEEHPLSLLWCEASTTWPQCSCPASPPPPLQPQSLLALLWIAPSSFFLRTFTCAFCSSWNILLPFLHSVPSLASFKSLLRSHFVRGVFKSRYCSLPHLTSLHPAPSLDLMWFFFLILTMKPSFLYLTDLFSYFLPGFLAKAPSEQAAPCLPFLYGIHWP